MEVGNLAQWASVLVSGVIATLAIWGDRVRSWLSAPQIVLSVHPGPGDLNIREGKKALYHHIILPNNRPWSPAKELRLLVLKQEKRGPDGSYFSESLVAPLQLTWAFPAFHELSPTVASTDACDLGYLEESTQRFIVTTYVAQRGSRGKVAAGESIRVHIVPTNQLSHGHSASRRNHVGWPVG
jgi:hypothetical protein